MPLPQRGPDPDPLRLHRGRDRQDEGGRGRPHDPGVRGRGPGQAPRGPEERVSDGGLEQGAPLLHPRHRHGALHPLHHHRHDRQVTTIVFCDDSLEYNVFFCPDIFRVCELCGPG